MRIIKNIRPVILACLVLFAFFHYSNRVVAQNFDNMREYLEIKDLLSIFKSEIEKELMNEHPATEEKINGYKQNLNKLGEKVKAFNASGDSLSGYYSERLNELFEKSGSLIPLLQNNSEILSKKNKPASQTPLSAPASPSISPPLAIPPAGAQISSQTTTEPVQKSAVSLPDKKHESQPDVKTTPVQSIVKQTSAKQTLPKKAQIPRKQFFLPIGFRNIIPRFVRGLGKKRNLPPVSVGEIAAVTEAALITPQQISLASQSAQISSQTTTLAISSGTQSISRVASEPPPILHEPLSDQPSEMQPLMYSSNDDPRVINEKGMRPVAVMVENHRASRPQTALEEAEMVYEIPVEGGITRFMAIFYHMVGVIGPVRSCRDYFLDRALEVNALYVHCGGSPQGYQYISSLQPVAIDEISSGKPFFRDNTRKAPHNLYTKMKDLVDFVGKKQPMALPYLRMPLRFGQNPTISQDENSAVHIKYHGNYSVSYKYSPQKNVYFRYMNGSQHLDRVNLKPIAPGTVIIQNAYMKVIDDLGRQDISFMGEGKAWVLRGGTILPCIWRKKAPREFTEFFDLSGKPVIFANDRPVWVQVVSPRERLTFDPPIEDESISISKATKKASTK
ncbi:MAG: DUF3048 domain-containing protein [Candidatus Riflebacteria bacterium]|nr:DUF3048 domain-containing protein [Candidatus Riflebacteria bacterium]